MFEELLDVQKKINPESYNPTKVARPNLEPALEYEDTPEFRKSLNMKVNAVIHPCSNYN
jgi:hypothetical protein